MAGGQIVKTRRDLTLILMQNEFEFPVTASEILELLNFDQEKLELAISLLNKIKTNIKKSKKMLIHLTWNDAITKFHGNPNPCEILAPA